MQGLFRRPSGVYVARLVVPPRHRVAVGKAELIESTGTRVLVIAQIVASEILARWRRKLYELDCRGCNMDLLKVALGDPFLKMGGTLPLSRASEASGFLEDDLLGAMSRGELQGFYAATNLLGHHIHESIVTYDSVADEWIVPSAEQISVEEGRREAFTGLLGLRDSRAVGAELLVGVASGRVAFANPARPGWLFAPVQPVVVERSCVHVPSVEVEAYRQKLSGLITPEQLAAAQGAAGGPAASTRRNQGRLISQAIDVYFKEHADTWSPEQRRRIRTACDLFVELMGDQAVGEVSRDHLRCYRDVVLPTVPAHENKIRLQRGTTTVSESIEAIKEVDWPRLSEGERLKRMQWLGQLFAWLAAEGWVTEDPAVGLGKPRGRIKVKKSERGRSKRRAFTTDELQRVFAADWFKTGRGELTAQQTYREFSSYYYWLPLLGLYTGARINELCQLHLADVRCTASGTWFIDINDDDLRKSLKTANAPRLVPIHQALLDLGFLPWVETLRGAGWNRLFPELKHDSVKGFSKGPVKWFSSYLSRLALVRDGTLVFHSFRHGLTTKYINEQQLPLAVVNQLGGWERGKSIAELVYRGDEAPDKLKVVVDSIRFDLPPIAPFDCAAGAQAIRDALKRKNRGLGASED